MLKSCSYCGKIHSKKEECPRKLKRKYMVTDIDRFRWTRTWQKKRKQINKRDHYMCQVCIRNLYNTQEQYKFDDIEVHHIIPIADDWELRLDDDNLICLCSYHHELAESGKIPRKELQSMIIRD